jgi:hypothetical protein
VEKFDFDQYLNRDFKYPPLKQYWIFNNYKNKISAHDFVKAIRGLKKNDTSKNKYDRYRKKNLYKTYRILKSKYRFFTGELSD